MSHPFFDGTINTVSVSPFQILSDLEIKQALRNYGWQDEPTPAGAESLFYNASGQCAITISSGSGTTVKLRVRSFAHAGNDILQGPLDVSTLGAGKGFILRAIAEYADYNPFRNMNDPRISIR